MPRRHRAGQGTAEGQTGHAPTRRSLSAQGLSSLKVNLCDIADGVVDATNEAAHLAAGRCEMTPLSGSRTRCTVAAPKAEPQLVVTPPSVVVGWMHGEGLIAALSNESGFAPWPQPPVFSLRFSRQDAHVLVAVQGDLDADSAPMLRQRLSDLIESQGNLSIVVDLRSTTFIDSSGLTVLVTAHKWLQARGGELRLLGPRRSAHRILQISGLSRILTIVQD